MMRSRCVLGLVVLSLSSVTYALDPLGPPQAIVGRNNWSLGLEYAYSETDTELTDIVDDDGPLPNVSSKGLKANRAYVTARYGVLDRVDVFGRVGAITMESPVLNYGTRFTGDADVTWGFGAAVTVYDSGQFDWGLVAQWSHGESEMDMIAPDTHMRTEMEIECFQVATGPTYQIREDLNLYGGGFYHTLDGEYERSSGYLRFDLEQDSSWGGFAGLDWAVKEDVRFHAEVQHTGTALAIATGLKWLFQ